MTNEINQRMHEVLSLFLTEPVPTELIHFWRYGDNNELQYFVSMHLKPSVEWCTAIGIIEAAVAIVDEAICNANLTLEGEINE